MKRKNIIIHSDHGSQHSSYEAINFVEKMDWKISMSRVGNSLDNREIEYFFGCLKGKFLKNKQTHKLNFSEIKNLVDEHISWENNFRIQKRLHWQAPTAVSQYAT